MSGGAAVGSTPATCCSLWIGGDLGAIAAACLSSFVRRGHRVVLYCYDQPKDVPDGVETADAGPIVSSDRIFKHKETGSYAFFSDLFRYQLMRASAGIWIDCDVYCVRPITTETPHVFGWQRAGSVNNAVLRLPHDSPVLDPLIALFAQKTPVPPWLSKEQSEHWLAARFAGEEFTMADLPWGSSGPEALTYCLGANGLLRHASPVEVFYPLPFNRGQLLLQAGADLRGIVTPRTLTIHLWNQMLSRHLDRAERGSAIDRLRRTGTLFDEERLGEPR
jgi:hypothetical protein